MSTLSGNPLVVTAADVAVAGLTVWRGVIHVLNIEFLDYLGDGDICEVTDTAGRVVWNGNGASDQSTVRSGHLGSIVGLVIAAGMITNGKVAIYHR